MEMHQKKSPKSISKVRKSGVQISRGGVFILAGVLTNTYILIPIGEDFSEKYPNQITNCHDLTIIFMIVHLPTGKTFITQKDAKLYFGNHYYRRLVKKGDIYFTDYKSKVANHPIQKNQ